jgi:hypothetical protein
MKLRFSVRELLLIVAVIALAVGWWIDHRRLTHHWVDEDEKIPPGWYINHHKRHIEKVPPLLEG